MIGRGVGLRLRLIRPRAAKERSPPHGTKNRYTATLSLILVLVSVSSISPSLMTRLVWKAGESGRMRAILPKGLPAFTSSGTKEGGRGAAQPHRRGHARCLPLDFLNRRGHPGRAPIPISTPSSTSRGSRFSPRTLGTTSSAKAACCSPKIFSICPPVFNRKRPASATPHQRGLGAVGLAGNCGGGHGRFQP